MLIAHPLLDDMTNAAYTLGVLVSKGVLPEKSTKKLVLKMQEYAIKEFAASEGGAVSNKKEAKEK